MNQEPRGKNLVFISSIFIIFFAVLAFLMAFISYIITNPAGMELLNQPGMFEVFESVPGISMDEFMDLMLTAFGIISVISLIAGIYQLLLGVLGLFFYKNSKRAPILIVLGAIALIFQSIVVFIFLLSSIEIAMFFGIGLVVYVLFLTGAIRNLKPHFSDPMILGPSNEALMAKVVMADEVEGADPE